MATNHTNLAGFLRCRLVRVLLASLLTPAVMAQGLPQLTPDQIKQLKQLPPGQLQQLKTDAVQSGVLQSGAIQSGTIPQEAPIVVVPTQTPAQPAAPAEKDINTATDKPKLNEPRQELSVRQKLKLFGYDLFEGTPTTFAPVTEIPVTSDYVLGPGDTIIVNTFGASNDQINLVVSREGTITYPGIGPIVVAGQTYEQMSVMLLKRIAQQFIGVKATITMGPLRSIRIFILGEATRPGAYTVSSMSTMTNALFVGGGVKTIGSLRNIALRRQGKTVTTLDLYDLLLRGDTSKDTRLLPGDVIFIPKIGETVGVAGEVLRPAIYELKGEKTVPDLLGLAGGMLPTAFPPATQLERIDERKQKTIVDADQSPGKAQKVKVQDGDVIRVFSILDRMDKIVLLNGHVHRPGGVQWRPNMHLTDLITGFDDLLPRPQMDFLVIKREVLPDRHIELLRANLAEALKNPQGAANVALQPRDEVYVFGEEGDRSKILDPLISQLRRQARLGLPALMVDVNGSVTEPGQYPLTSGMRLNDLVVLTGGLDEDADTKSVVVSRQVLPDRHIEVFRADLAEALKNPAGAANIALQPHDEIFVFALKEDRSDTLKPLVKRLGDQSLNSLPTMVVSVNGSVFAPGPYPLTTGMRVSDLVFLSGNLDEGVDTRFAILKREVLPDRRIDVLRVDLTGALKAPQSAADIRLQPHDTLYVFGLKEDRAKTLAPLVEQLQAQARSGPDTLVVNVSGSVFSPGAFPLTEGMRIGDLILLAGNLSEDAYQLTGEIVRYGVDDTNARTTAVKQFNLAAILAGDKSQNLQLRPFDSVLIRPKPGWNERASIEIDGKVRFPGRYQVTRGEKLSSVIRRAGGFLDIAAPEAAVFQRVRLKAAEQEAIDQLAQRLQAELSALSLQSTSAEAQGFSTPAAQAGVGANPRAAFYSSTLKTLQSTKPVGRLAIELQRIVAETRDGGSSDADVTVEDGDKLFVPGVQESITVAGQVNYPSSHRYENGSTVNDYLNRAGGASQNADESRIFVIHANGSVETAGKSWWAPSFIGGGSLLRPGDTIVVPLDVKQVAPITLWSSISQIFMNTAVAAAALKTLGIVH